MRRLIGLAVLAILLVAYLTTLQTIPNGSEHYYMIDVGETQNVLNQWGTLHATGYPLYVMVGNVLVAGLRILGVNAATGPGVASLIYGMIALGLIYVLAARVVEEPMQPHPLSPLSYSEGGKQATEGGSQTLPYGNARRNLMQPPPLSPSPQARRNNMQPALLAGGMVLVFGLTRTVWVHNSIAEVYSFGLMILAGLFLIALWPEPIRGRVYWLALLGGIGAFHHRAIAMAAPALVFAVWGEIISRTPQKNQQDEQMRTRRASSLQIIVTRVVICLGLGLLGFLPYVYLPLRANAGAKWVYGDPGNWTGFWDQFLGREASRFIGTPTTNAGLIANFNLVNTVLVTDVTAVGIVLGLVGLLWALWIPARRKVAITMLLSGGVAYGFHVLFYTDILSALILPVTLALAFGWLLLAERLLEQSKGIFYHKGTKNTETEGTQRGEPLPQPSPVYRGGSQSWVVRKYAVMIGITAVVVVAAGYLWGQNEPFIHEMTTNPTGLETIELAKGTPDEAVLMLDWGPRYYAVAFAQDLLGELPNVTLVTHKADFKTLVNVDKQELVTADFTFYNRPVSWWEDQLGHAVYLRAAAPHLVEIGSTPLMATVQTGNGILVNTDDVVCTANSIQLDVNWVATSTPDHDLSVYVHLLDQDGTMIAQADEAAPVYGWRPLTSWQVGEVVHDVYALPRLPNADTIDYGLYRQLPSGEFQNEYTFHAAVKCDG